MGWKWETGTPRERAEVIRSHFRGGLSHEQVRAAFGLTRRGYAAISRGGDWRPSYRETPAQQEAPAAYARDDGTQMIEVAPHVFVNERAVRSERK